MALQAVPVAWVTLRMLPTCLLPASRAAGRALLTVQAVAMGTLTPSLVGATCFPMPIQLAKVQAELEAAQRDGAHALSERGRQLQQLQAQLAAQQQEDAGLLRQWQHEQSENARLRSELQAKRTELQVGV